MVFLKRSIPVNSKKRPAISSDNIHDSAISASTSSAVESSISSVVNTVRSSKGRAIREIEGDDDDQDVNLMISILAEGGCTLRVSRDAPPSLPDDPHNLRRHIEFRLSSSEPPSILSRFLSGFTAYIRSPQNLRRVLIPAKHNGDGLSCGESLLRVLLVVAPLQQHILNLLLEKLPEHFNADAASASCSLKDDIARLIVHQLRWLDFVVDSEPFAEKLMEVLSISPPRLKKEIIGSLPEIIGEKCHATVVAALEKMLIEDSDVIVPVLDSFINLNLDEHLQEQAVTIALSCIRTVDGEHMPHLLRFLLFSTTPANATRIILQIRDQLKLTVSNPFSARNKKLKGKSPAENTEASILDALRTSLRFKNVLCEAVLKELKSLNQPSQHKAIDLWFLMLIYNNGGSLQKDAQKVLKKKIVDGCFGEALFDQCIGGNQELIKVYFLSFISLSEYLLSCKEQQARRLSIHLYVSLFDEFKDTYSRQEVLGALVTHIGSGIAHEVDSALEALILLTSRFSEELISLSSHITGILDYMESFHEENLHKVYEVFSRLSLSAKFKADTNKSSIGNELLIIIRKQISNADMMYRKMGVIGTFKVVSTLGDANAPSCFPSSQKSNADDALELLQMSLDSCKLAPSTLILLYDELIALLKNSILKPQIIEWIGKHASEFEPMFLSDLEGGQLPSSASCDGIEGELWINLDGDASPICLKILPLLSSPLHQQSESLQTLPSQFLLLSVVERYSNQGSLGGIDALLGCPLHLPSAKFFSGVHWKKLSERLKKIVSLSLFYAINWIIELINAFCSQIADRVESLTPNTKVETATKLMKRLRSLVVMESMFDAILKVCPLSLPEVCYSMNQYGPNFRVKKSSERALSEIMPSKKRKKHKTDPSVPCKSGSASKLRQPTIIDALKKTGVPEGQEVSNDGSPAYISHEKIPQCADHHSVRADALEAVDISNEPKVLELERSKLRPLNTDSLILLTFSEGREACCADPAAELPLHLHLLRDLHRKLKGFSSPSKQSPAACSAEVSPGVNQVKSCEFLSKIKPTFGSLRRHLDTAVFLLRDGSGGCNNHWKSELCSAGIPDLSNLMTSTTSIASSVFREVIRCFNMILRLDELYYQENLQILKDLLEVFQSTETPCNYFLELQKLSMPGSMDYVYCGVYSFLECILETSLLLSFLMASEVVIALQSLVSSKVLLIKSQETKGKSIYSGCSQDILRSLINRLASSAHRLLVYDCSGNDNETEWKRNGEIMQKILQIYLTNAESTSDLLNELACSILPQIPSSKASNTQDATHGFPTLCPTMFHIWYKVLHEENINALSKLLKEVKLKHVTIAGSDSAGKMLAKIQQSVQVVVSLVNLCKSHDKVAVHAMAVKYGGKYVELFLKAFDFLQAQFQSHNELIIEMFKEFQKATRVIQTLCSEAKGSKRTMVTSKVPATKKSMEKFLFHVKALLHNNSSSGCTFWMGNLKHKDLHGQVVSSQLYENGGGDDDDEYNSNENELYESVGDCERR